MTPEEIRQRAVEAGNRAKEVAEHPELRATLHAMRDEITKSLQSADTPEEAFRVAVRFQQMQFFEATLQAAMTAGRQAAAAILADQRKADAERAKASRVRDRIEAARAAREKYDREFGDQNNAKEATT